MGLSEPGQDRNVAALRKILSYKPSPALFNLSVILQKKISFFTVLGAFLLYFTLQALVFPFFYFLTFETQNYYKMGIYTILFSSLVIFLLTNPLSLWNVPMLSFKRVFALLGKAFLYLLLLFPLSLVAANLIFMMINLFSAIPFEVMEQEAVQQIKELRGDPLRFWPLALIVSTFVPLAEEILFRGLLQNWLMRYISPFLAVVVASLIFSAFHLTTEQGATNFPIFSSLFILSCFLGYFYKQEKTLLAPVFLHGLFNLTTIIFIYLDLT